MKKSYLPPCITCIYARKDKEWPLAVCAYMEKDLARQLSPLQKHIIAAVSGTCSDYQPKPLADDGSN